MVKLQSAEVVFNQLENREAGQVQPEESKVVLGEDDKVSTAQIRIVVSVCSDLTLSCVPGVEQREHNLIRFVDMTKMQLGKGRTSMH